MTHVEVPEQPPLLQPAKLNPELGVAVSVTVVLPAKLNEQTVFVLPQEIPTGELVIRPRPVPPVDTVIENGPAEVKVAMITLELFIVK